MPLTRYVYFNLAALPSDDLSLPPETDTHLLTKLDILALTLSVTNHFWSERVLIFCHD